MSWSNNGDVWKDFERDMAISLGLIKEADIKPCAENFNMRTVCSDGE